MQLPIGVIISALIGLFGCRVIYAEKIDDSFVWIVGTGDAFRSSFPEWPGGHS
ncbi:MAG: hypothetical protein ACK5OB_15735 [Pirellula sp.]